MIIDLYLTIFIFFIHYVVLKNKKIIFNNHFLDKPNLERKIHKKPTYLIGGHFIFFSYTLFFLFSLNDNIIAKIIFLFIFLCVFCIGILDDLKDLKPTLKLFLILCIYLILIYYDTSYLLTKIYLETFNKHISFGNFSYLISPLCILLLVNAFNLIDGINGLAMLIFLIINLFLYNYLNTDLNFFLLFFYFFIFVNIYKGQYFLGNSGSLIVGILIGLTTIKFYNDGYIQKNSAEDIVILFLIPGIDMLRLFVQRILNKKNPFKADNLHLHHLLIKKFPLEIVLFFYFSIIVGTSYLAFNDYVSEFKIIISIIIVYTLSLILLHKSIKKLNE